MNALREKRRLKIPRGNCKVCGREFALWAAKGDWLNALYPRKHRGPDGKPCDGWHHETEITREPLHEK